MRLFFETGAQSASFLAAVPIGFALAFCLDWLKGKQVLRLVLDVCFFLLAGLSLLVLTIFLSEEKLRLYHLLGMIVGSLLYVRGIRAFVRGIIRFFQNRKRNIDDAEGIPASQGEEIKNQTGKDEAICARP